MEREHVDIIEVFLKKDLDIPLTEIENHWFNTIDDYEKQTIFELVNNSSYIEELIRLLDKIKQDSQNLPVEEQKEICEKCDMKKQKLEDSKFSNVRKII